MEDNYETSPWVLSLTDFALNTNYDESNPSTELMWWWLMKIEPIELFRLGDALVDEEAEIGDADDGYFIADFILFARSMERGTPNDMSFDLDELELWMNSFTAAVALFPFIRAGLMFPPRTKTSRPSLFELPDDYGWVITSELNEFTEAYSSADLQLALLDEIERREGR